jgi:predicted transcriptional regulator
MKYQQNIERIKKLAQEGRTSLEIAEILDLEKDTVKEYARKERIELVDQNRRISRSKRKQSIEQEIENGAEFVEQIAEHLGLNPKYIINFAYEENISLPRLKNPYSRYLTSKIARRNPEIDRLIEKGLTLQKIGERISGYYSEKVRQYLVRTRQHEVWKATKEEGKTIIKRLVSQIRGLGEQIANGVKHVGINNATKKEKFAHEKTTELFLRKKIKNDRIPFDKLFSIFSDYYEFQEQGRRVSITWFAEKYELYPYDIGRIFKLSRLPTLVSTNRKKRVETSQYKKQCLERSVEIELSSTDLAYFLNLPCYVVQQYFYEHYYKGDKKRLSFRCYAKKFGDSSILAYRTTSHIYEALDSGFRKREIMQAYEILRMHYVYAIENRPEIEKHLIQLLRRIFPDKQINTPYLEFKVD